MVEGARGWLVYAAGAITILVGSVTYAHPGTGIAVDKHDHLYVADPERDKVWLIQINEVGRLGDPRTALEAHVHSLAVSPDGLVLAEAQEYNERTGRWLSQLWRLEHPDKSELLVSEESAGFTTITSPFVDAEDTHYAWDADMVDRTYSRFLYKNESGEHALIGGVWRSPRNTHDRLLGNIGGFQVSREGEILFTDFSCLRSFFEGKLTTISCDELLKRPWFSLTFGDHNHLRGLTRGEGNTTWIANYASRRVVEVNTDGSQSTTFSSRRGFRPVGVFYHRKQLFILEHGSNQIRVQVLDLITKQVDQTMDLPPRR